MTDNQKEIALTPLSYLQIKEEQSTFTDDYYYCLKSKRFTEFEIENLIEALIQEEYISYLGKDQYWIQLTSKGDLFVKNKGKDSLRINWKLIIEITVAILGLIAALASF